MNPRVFLVSRAESGRTVAAVLRAHLPLPWSAVRRLIEAGLVRVGGAVCRNAARRVKPGQRLAVQLPTDSAKTPDREQQTGKVGRTKDHGLAPVIRYADAQVVVVEKPAGVTTM